MFFCVFFCNIVKVNHFLYRVIILLHSISSFLLTRYLLVPYAYISIKSIYCILFFIRVLFHRHWWFTGQQGKGGGPLLFYSAASTRSQTFRNIFTTFYVRWLSRIFNRNTCIYQAATRWDLPPHWITIWLIDWWCNVGFFVYLMIWFYVFVTVNWHGKPIDLNSHRLSPLYYRQID